jgi:glycosyltransferase involved in cell wall biosynthesis
MQSGLRRPRTVLFLHGSSGRYGADRQLEVLVRGLDPSRYRPVVVLPEPGPLQRLLDESGIETRLMPLAVLRRDLLRGRGAVGTARLLSRNARELGEMARQLRAAVVHTNASSVLCGQAVARRASAAHVLHVREIYVKPDGRRNPLWRPLRHRLLRADAVACVSKAAAAQFPPSDRVFVLYDGLTRPSPRISRAEARSALQIEANAFVVTTIGRISDWKGQDVLLRALADPLLAELGTIGIVVGDAAPHQPYFEHELASLSAELNLDGRVRLLGFREDIDVLLAAADAIAVPSTFPDPLPNAAIEGAIAERPVVATSTGGQPEIVLDGKTGYVVPPSDPPALARALRSLADSPAAASQLGVAGARAAAAKFDPARLVDELQERYDRVLATRETGPPAWLLPVKRLPVPQPAAPDLRLAHQASWLRELGYRPVILFGWGLRPAFRVWLRALRERPALVVAAAAAHAPAVTVLKALRRRTVVVADVFGLHSLEIDQAFRPPWARRLARPVWTALERRLTRAAHMVVAVNDRHADIVRERYKRHSVFTLRDTAEPETASIPPFDRTTHGIPEDAVTVGFAGWLVYSRLDAMLDAWERLTTATDRKICLLVAGGGPDLERYRQRAAKIASATHPVIFLGGLPRDDALAAMRACDVGYSDCWTEAGFPMKVFEYMALGLPIVTEGKPQTEEVLHHERDALLYRTSDELVDYLLRLIADPDLRARLGEAARRSFLEHHTVEQRQREFEALVDGLQQPRTSFPRPKPALVSVVLPVRDAEEYVAGQLAALSDQDYAGAWEVVVVDNGSTDRSIEIVESWRSRLPSLTVVREQRRGLNRARNAGAGAARGDLLAFCDADDVAAPGWLAALAEAAPATDLVGGALDFDRLNGGRSRGWRPYAPPEGLLEPHGFLPYVPGGNVAVWADVAREVGWDDSYRFGSSDVEFAWRAQLAGYRPQHAPEALIAVRFRTGLGETLRQHLAYGMSAPHLHRSFRSFGMRSAGFRSAIGAWTALVWNSPDLLRSSERRGHWLRLASERVGRLCGCVRWRTTFP